jgi:hypothetical protein
MTLVIPSAASADILNAILNTSSLSPFTLHLYANDYTPSVATRLDNLVEMAGGGYAAKTLPAGAWGVAVGEPSLATYARQSFLFTGAAGPAYGYYVTSAAGDLVWVERFDDGPYNIAHTDDEVKVTPTFSFENKP